MNLDQFLLLPTTSRRLSQIQQEISKTLNKHIDYQNISSCIKLLYQLWDTENHLSNDNDTLLLPPFSILRDDRINGSLFRILLISYEYLFIDNLESWDLDNQQKQTLLNKIISFVEMQTPPVHLFMYQLPEPKMALVLEYATSLNFRIVENISLATHVLIDALTHCKNERCVAERDGYSLMHLAQTPDSQDHWIPSTHCVDQQTFPEKWYLSFSWIEHCKLYKTRMSEFDYLIQVVHIEGEQIIIQEEPNEEIEEIEDYIDEQPQTHYSPESAFPKVVYIDLDERAAPKSKRHEFEPISEPDIINISGTVEQLYKPTSGIIIPSMANWFSMDHLHPIEEKAFPDFVQSFQLEKSVEIYKRMRNQIVGLYRQSTLTYLTVSRCVEVLDVGLQQVLRIHGFLEFWGLINFQARNLPFPKSQYAIQPQFIKSEHPNPIYDMVGIDIFEEDIMVKRCSQCGYSPLGEIWYRTLKPYNVVICSDCYLNGNYPSHFSSKQFVRFEKSVSIIETIKDPNHNEEINLINQDNNMDTTMQDDSLQNNEPNCNNNIDIEPKQNIPEMVPWTDDELLHFLECIDKYGHDWNLISQYMGTRSMEDCIRKFISLPISTNHEEPIETLKDLFKNSDNPLISFLHAIGQSLNEGVASHGARTALNVLANSNDIKSVKIKGLDNAFESSVESCKEYVEVLLKEQELKVLFKVKELVDCQCQLNHLKLKLLSLMQ